VLAFEREVEDAPVFRCTVNMGDEPVAVGRPGELLLASGPIEGTADNVVLPPDTTVWWSISR
jgi:alpha-glucosidase